MTATTPPRDRPATGDQLAVLVARSLRTTARVPQLLMFSLTMPMAMLVLFSQVFRSVADGPAFPAGVSYIDYLTPAMLAVTTVMAGTNAGVAAAIDHTNGLHDRFATLPMPPAFPGWPAPSTRPSSPWPASPSCSPGPRCWGSGSTAASSTPRPALLVLVVLAGGDERPVRPHRRPAAPPRRRAVRRDDGDDAVHVHLRRLRAAGHHARLDGSPRRPQPGRPRRRRPARHVLGTGAAETASPPSPCPRRSVPSPSPALALVNGRPSARGG